LWKTNRGEMELHQTNKNIIGKYAVENELLKGKLEGNRLKGTLWELSNETDERNKISDFQFIISHDCTIFRGERRVGKSKTWEDWTDSLIKREIGSNTVSDLSNMFQQSESEGHPSCIRGKPISPPNSNFLLNEVFYSIFERYLNSNYSNLSTITNKITNSFTVDPYNARIPEKKFEEIYEIPISHELLQYQQRYPGIKNSLTDTISSYGIKFDEINFEDIHKIPVSKKIPFLHELKKLEHINNHFILLPRIEKRLNELISNNQDLLFLGLLFC